MLCAEWLSFPSDRDQLVNHLVQDLSPCHLLPREGSEGQGEVVCKSRLTLMSGLEARRPMQ